MCWWNAASPALSVIWFKSSIGSTRMAKNYTIIDWCRVTFTVISSQDFKVHVDVETYVILGNDALLKCQVPSFVSDLVDVFSWIMDDRSFLPNGGSSFGDFFFFKKRPMITKLSHRRSSSLSYFWLNRFRFSKWWRKAMPVMSIKRMWYEATTFWWSVTFPALSPTLSHY